MNSIQSKIEHWLDEAVIGLNLCPFAKRPRLAGEIKIIVLSVDSIESVLEAIITESHELIQKNEGSHTTSLIATPDFLDEFDDYLDVLEAANTLLNQLRLEGQIQIASFHPKYQFEGSEMDDISNLTNRSPYPIFHLIREDILEQAIHHYGDTNSIPANNIARLKSLTDKQIKAIFGDRAK